MKVTLELHPDTDPRDLDLLRIVASFYCQEADAPRPAQVPPQETPAKQETPSPQETPAKQEKPAPETRTATREEWVSVNRAKRIELLIDNGMERAALRPDYNRYIAESCTLAFRTETAKLNPEQLYALCQWVNTITFNPRYVPGSPDENCRPFVSPAPIKTL